MKGRSLSEMPRPFFALCVNISDFLSPHLGADRGRAAAGGTERNARRPILRGRVGEEQEIALVELVFALFAARGALNREAVGQRINPAPVFRRALRRNLGAPATRRAGRHCAAVAVDGHQVEVHAASD